MSSLVKKNIVKVCGIYDTKTALLIMIHIIVQKVLVSIQTLKQEQRYGGNNSLCWAY